MPEDFFVRGYPYHGKVRKVKEVPGWPGGLRVERVNHPGTFFDVHQSWLYQRTKRR